MDAPGTNASSLFEPLLETAQYSRNGPFCNRGGGAGILRPAKPSARPGRPAWRPPHGYRCRPGPPHCRLDTVGGPRLDTLGVGTIRQIPGAHHVAWRIGLDAVYRDRAFRSASMAPNPDFVDATPFGRMARSRRGTGCADRVLSRRRSM